jgi:hypothetical protein
LNAQAPTGYFIATLLLHLFSGTAQSGRLVICLFFQLISDESVKLAINATYPDAVAREPFTML